MNQTPPFLSVVIPTYNRQDSLRVTLDGLARQSYAAENFEVVVVSDGATDGTSEMLQAYTESASFTLRFFVQENSGPARARNRGIKEARENSVVVFLDDDVEPIPDFLAVHAAHHARDVNAVVIGPMSPDPARRAVEPVWIGWEHAMLEKQYACFRSGEWKSAGPNHFYSGNASVRRAHLMAIGGFDETFTRQEDVEMAFRLEQYCGVSFTFEHRAQGLHRPARTFSSWLAVPFAYGKWDVIRAQRGDAGWDLVRHGFISRSRATQRIAQFALRFPRAAPPLRATLLAGAKLAYGAGRANAAFAALSVLNNVRYLEGARDELGNDRELWRRLREESIPVSVRAANGVLRGEKSP